MMKIVRFNTSDMAANVKQHLYHVEQDCMTLVFSTFDETAFNAAITLEGLTRADYSYVGNQFSGISHRFFGPPRITLSFTLEAPRNHYHALSVNVLSDTRVALYEGCRKFPLAIDSSLLSLISLLCTEDCPRILEIASTLRIAILKVEELRTLSCEPLPDNCLARCTLVIRGASASQELQFYSTEVCVNVNYPTFD